MTLNLPKVPQHGVNIPLFQLEASRPVGLGSTRILFHYYHGAKRWDLMCSKLYL